MTWSASSALPMRPQRGRCGFPVRRCLAPFQHNDARALVSIELKHLRYAEVAERCGSFRKAADLLALKQSNLSRRVRYLEEQLGGTARPEHYTAGAQNICQAGPQAHADRGRRLPPRLPARTRPTRRSRRERTSHHGVEKRAAAYPRRRFKRKNGGFWRAQFCTEVARRRGFELRPEIAGPGLSPPPPKITGQGPGRPRRDG